MKTEIRAENEMKDSGIEYVGAIPKDWTTERIKNLFSERNERVDDAEPSELLSVSEYYGVAPRNEKINADIVLVRAESLQGYKRCEKNDLVSNIMLAWKGAMGISQYRGVVSPSYCVYTSKKDICSRYYHYLLRTDAYKGLFKKYSTGIIESRLRLYTEQFFARRIIVPGLPEQQAIADYLDEVCSKIDEIIAEAKASIEEYKELKQAVIFEAVTKGLDRNVEIKDVNIEYLESCPMDWHILPISMLFDFFGGFAYKSDRFCEKTNNQVVRLGNVKDDELRLNSNPVYVSDEYANASSKATIKVDDILFTMTGTRGKGDYFYTLIITENDLKDRNLLLNQRVGCFRKAYHTVYMPYYNYLLKSSKIRERVFLYETGTANQGNIGIENINRIRLYNPPMEVQKNIVITLKHKCSEIDSLITEKEALIADLEAYKKSLIYELVTGKRRVV